MAPLILPSLNSFSTLSAEPPNKSPSCFTLSISDELSVRITSFAADNEDAIAQATKSGLTTFVMPFDPLQIGATTGIKSDSSKKNKRSVFTLCGSPTNPISIIFSTLFGCPSQAVKHTFFASTKHASLPLIPMADPPLSFIVWTISLLTKPDRTISVISRTSESITRKSFTKTPSFFPNFSRTLSTLWFPPCTMIGLTPTCFNNTMSLAKLSANTLSSNVTPSSFTTKVSPENC